MAKPPPDPSYVLRAHQADAQAVCFSTDGTMLYSGDAAGVLIVWLLDRRRPAFQQSIHPADAGILSLHYLQAQPSKLLSQGRDGTLKLWLLDGAGIPAGKPVATVQTFSFSFCRCTVQQNAAWPPIGIKEASGGTTLAALAGSRDGDAEIWRDIEGSPRLDKSFSQPESAMKCGMCMAVQFVPGSGSSCVYLLVGYEDGSLALWSPADTIRPQATVKPHSEPVMALSVRQQEAFSGSAEDCVFKLIIGTSPPGIAVSRKMQLKQAGTADLAVREDGRVVAAAGWDGRVRLFSCKTGATLAVLKYHRSGVAAVAFDSSSGWLASSGRDCTIAMWDVYRS